jgi:type II secretory pathway component GspD/PulD (secretin)
MKPKLSLLTLVVLLACSAAGLAQNDPAAPPAALEDAQPTAVAEDQASPAEPAGVDTVPAPAEPAAPALPTAPAVMHVADVGDPAAPRIPLIVMDEVPLTDAIRNLARQAGLNLMLDPKINFGQPGPDGKMNVQPMVSVRWEDVTAQEALGALLANYNLQMVVDPKIKIARITVKDPAAPEPLATKVFQLKYASPTNMLESISTALTDKRSKAVADVRTSQVVVLATQKELTEVEGLIEKLDTPTKQVLIEARLVETSMNPSTIKGLDWTGTLQEQNLKFGNNLQQNTPSESVNNTLVGDSVPKMLFDTAKGFNPSTAFLDADGVSAVLSFMNKYSEAKVLSAPRAVTLDNETAFISVTRASPIFKNTAGTQGSPGGSEVTYTNLGVLLEVTPRISADNQVNLRVIPEVSRVFNTVTKTVAGTVNQADEYDIRKIDTRVMIPSGNTLVLGGLIQDDIRKSNNKVPFFGDIPVLGSAFRSDSKSRQKANLMIFITPTIVQDGDFQPTETTFLKNKVPKQDSMEPDWSAWDSGKPKERKKKKQAEADLTDETAAVE